MIFNDEKCIAVAYLFHKFGSRNADNISKCETVSLFYIHSTILFISHLHFFAQSCLNIFLQFELLLLLRY